LKSAENRLTVKALVDFFVADRQRVAKSNTAERGPKGVPLGGGGGVVCKCGPAREQHKCNLYN